MNSSDHQSLFASLNDALEILTRNRTSDPEFVAAFDTLKQARAKIARVMPRPEARRELVRDTDLVAA